MKNNILYISVAILIVTQSGCSVNDDKKKEMTAKQIKSTILFEKPTEYLSLLSKNNPVAISYSATNYSGNKTSNDLVILRNIGENKIILDSANTTYMKISDSCRFSSDSSKHEYKLHINRQINFNDERVMSEGERTLTSSDTMISIQDVTPIQICAPIFEECNKIPYCWYDMMDICWNADVENENGVLIVAAWTGVVLEQPTSPQAPRIYNIDLVEDNGYTTLDNNLFQGMPDRAIVTLMLIRANILHVEYYGENVVLVDPSANDGDEIQEAVNQYLLSDYELLFPAYTIARGSVAYFSFVLVRNLQ